MAQLRATQSTVVLVSIALGVAGTHTFVAPVVPPRRFYLLSTRSESERARPACGDQSENLLTFLIAYVLVLVAFLAKSGRPGGAQATHTTPALAVAVVSTKTCVGKARAKRAVLDEPRAQERHLASRLHVPVERTSQVATGVCTLSRSDAVIYAVCSL